MTDRCVQCGVPLTADERTYYETRCEVCEGEAFHREADGLPPAASQARRNIAIEATAAACGLLGSYLLATKGDLAAWGWVAFLASNAGWIAFGWIRRHWFLVAQQVGFTYTSLLGIWRWLL